MFLLKSSPSSRVLLVLFVLLTQLYSLSTRINAIYIYTKYYHYTKPKTIMARALRLGAVKHSPIFTMFTK